MNESRFGLKDNGVGFFAGLASGFGFYTAWMILAMLWQTATFEEANIKAVLGAALGLAVGVLLYLGVYLGVNKKLGGTITRYTIMGIVAGLVIAFLVGLLFYNPAGVGFSPPFG